MAAPVSNSFRSVIERLRLLFIPALSLFAAACEPTTSAAVAPPGLTAEALAGQPAESATEARSQPPYDTADPERGHKLYLQCQVCHSIDAGQAVLAGPPLYGIIGRSAGTWPGFNYSPALREAGFVWSAAAMDAWIAAPLKFLPASRMPYAGLQNPRDRADLVAYLLQDEGGGAVSE